MAIFGQVTVQIDDVTPKIFDLRRPMTRIGRLPQNEIVLQGDEIAPEHAELRSDSRGVSLVDLGGPAAVEVRGIRLVPFEPHFLTDGTEIRIGPYLLTYRLGSRSRFLENLPGMFHENDLLRRLLLIFESIWEPLEQRQDFLETYFDPRLCPASFLPWLGSWMSIPMDPHWPEERMRKLLLEASRLYRLRGTREGLVQMLEICAPIKAEVKESPDSPLVIQVNVRPTDDRAVEVPWIETLVETHKPAHVGYVLEVVEP